MSQGAKTVLTRYGGWLPANRAIHKSFLKKHVDLIKSPYKANAGHIPSVDKFEKAIRADPEMLDLFNQIFLQIADFDSLLYMLDIVLEAPPKYHIAKDKEGNVIGEPIGVPVYLLFDLLSNTCAGHDLFRKKAFNDALQELLNSWGAYLKTGASASSLNDQEEGWFSTVAIQALEEKCGGVFNSVYVTPDPKAVNRGYTSWDAFFAREVQATARPVHEPNNNTLIHSACESTVFGISTKVKEHDQFWLKGQPYSLYDLLNHNKLAESFVGGTIYQAFLSPLDYHRWRSPVKGTIFKVELVPGTYYAVLPDEGAPEDDPDLKPGDPHARALIWIQADNPDIGLVCFVSVGMAEVSTNDVKVTEGQKVAIGEELGMFHFGGSSHALIFGPKTNITFADHVVQDQHIKVNSIIAQVSAA